LSKRALQLKVDELRTDIGLFKNLEVTVGRVYEETWPEKVGPTPFPSIMDLRDWDLKLLKRYEPFYMPFCDLCCLCTMGKCDLTKQKRGACGLDIAGQQSRIVLIAACIGASTHTAHARHLVEHLIGKYGRDCPIDMGRNVEVEAPIIRTVCGIRPKALGDLEDVLDYVESQVTQLLAATHTGQEENNLDFESKVFHAGMLDHTAMEVADIAQISSMGFPKADPDAPLAEIGFGVVDISKPTILVIGHNVVPAGAIMDYIEGQKLYGQVEVAGICCTAHDLTRYNPRAKIVGPLSWQLRFIRSGLSDLIVLDEQCIRTDTVIEAQKIKAPVIVTSDKNCAGLENRTADDVERIVADLVSGKAPGVLILNPEKVGEVAVRVAMEIAPKRRKFKTIPNHEEISAIAKKCSGCGQCRRACPNDLPIPEAMAQAAKGDSTALSELLTECIGCARCESACPNSIAVHSLLVSSAGKSLSEERYKIRVGRGGIQDVEIRNVGSPIVLGEIPGVVAFVGCANYPHGGREISEMAEEFVKRRYIVTSSGCAAMSVAMHRNEDGKNIYEAYPGGFDAGCFSNVGSCVSNSHIAGAAIKIASIFAKRSLRGNYEEIADYVLNRVGAVGVAWGAMSQKAAAIASGFWRLGIPVVVGPHGMKYRRMLLGRKDRDADWYVYDARTGNRTYVGPAPEHLFYAAETKEEAIVMIAKLCMRPNDTSKGRAIKLTHYVDLHKRMFGTLPDDVHLFVRRSTDIPITMKDEIEQILTQKGWREREIPDPTMLPRLIRGRRE
jgi:acetyl-CoA decarbonylase/synthase complex subunit alpha